MKKKRRASDIQSVIMTVLSLMTVITSISMGLLLYNRYETAMRQNDVRDAQNMMETIVNSMEQYLKSMRQISDTANYNIIQALDISSPEFNQELSLLYDSNKDKIQSIALYDMEGELLVAEPVTLQKEGVEVSRQSWFENAKAKIENMHFSTPHMQDLFQDDAKRYHWVISLSRAVDVIDGDSPENGILLVDMKYSMIREILERINQSSDEVYYYLCNRDGEMIYHPRQAEIDRGLLTEESGQIKEYEDGTYELPVNGQKGSVVVGSISYTGWRLVGVVPDSVQTSKIQQFRYYIVVTTLIFFMMLLGVNRIVARKISNPIFKLNESVKAYETGKTKDIYIGGFSEIRHLGYSVKKSYEQIEVLMEEIIRQQNEKRKSEMDALQSQINPHFLYNTLESITWMVEANKNEEAVFMISELAKLLRISLSKGRTVIRIADELQHSTSYMNIQKVRYKDRFETEFLIEEEIKEYCTIKLIIQPILENAIYYGVGNMDEDDGGKITVKGKKDGNDIYISVIDNGMGMSEEIVENLLLDNGKVPKHGSGVGLINVHTRIQLMYGKEYGLKIYSEPDEGTEVVIHIPAIPFSEENRKKLEEQTYRKGEAYDEKK